MMEKMKIVNVAIGLVILVLASISCAAVIGLSDSANAQDKVVSLALSDLKVQAEGNTKNAYPGYTGNAEILVLVTNKGASVGDLAENAFTLKTFLMPPGGGAIKKEQFKNCGNGAYTFKVVPTGGDTWSAGEYDIQVSVSSGGQAIASIEVWY